MTQKHCYLFALEIEPMEVGGVYDELPLHCTLMHRFWCDLLPEELADKVQLLFSGLQPLPLKARERLLLGPKQVAVSELELTESLRNLHMQLFDLLNTLGVEYTEPAWVGDGYRAHATERKNAKLEIGTEHISRSVYLIEVKVPGYDHKRFVRTKLNLLSQK
jgi:hypothetical protein